MSEQADRLHPRAVGRRRFLTTSLAAGASVALAPSGALGFSSQATTRHVPSDRPLNLAFIGIGNRGNEMLKTFAATDLVKVTAFADVDLDGAHTKESRDLYPAVPRFRDFRAMLDKMDASIDAVCVAVPDHAHFPIAMEVMRRSKHIYLEKPLAHTFREVDLLMAMAAKSGVVTQMGNQGHSGNNFFQFKAWTEAGVIKDVTRVVLFMNSWRQWHGWKITGFPAGEPLPKGMDWDLWNAARPEHPFSGKLHPKTWRSWYHYGDGALGDWAPHMLDTAHRFLNLGLPHTIDVQRRDEPSDYIFPQATTLRLLFGARDAMPPVEVFWYDGQKNLPPLPVELGPNAALKEQAGKFIYSKTLVFKGGTHGDTLRIIPESKMLELAPALPKVRGPFSDHAVNFVRGCHGREETRSPFSVGGPLTQVLLLGVIGQHVGGTLSFDPVTRKFVGNDAANALLEGPPVRKGWEEYYRV
jgi:predicted dehydrogenase